MHCNKWRKHCLFFNHTQENLQNLFWWDKDTYLASIVFRIPKFIFLTGPLHCLSILISTSGISLQLHRGNNYQGWRWQQKPMLHPTHFPISQKRTLEDPKIIKGLAYLRTGPLPYIPSLCAFIVGYFDFISTNSIWLWIHSPSLFYSVTPS